MEKAIQYIYNYPIISIIALSTAGILFIIIIKKLVKLLVIILIFASLYMGYITYTGQNISFFDDDIINQGKSKIIRLKNRSLEAKEKLFSEILKNK
jgi:hypothetical protein